jgi:hypothetical protein
MLRKDTETAFSFPSTIIRSIFEILSAGTGTRYQHDLIVTANDPYDGAFMANETFASDSVVDIKPYVPASWHPDYEHVLLATGTDTTGFVYDPTDQALVYRHKEGVEYPVTCRLAPNTNLEWESYVDSGMVIKPADTVYNSVSVGVVVYGQNDDDRYLLNFTPSGVYLDGGGINNEYKSATTFDAGDTLFYKVSAQTFDVDTVSDSIVQITAEAWIGDSGVKEVFANRQQDVSSSRVTQGYPGIRVDYSELSEQGVFPSSPLRIGKVWVRKENEEAAF